MVSGSADGGGRDRAGRRLWEWHITVGIVVHQCVRIGFRFGVRFGFGFGVERHGARTAVSESRL
jgi:hypothetical protein